MQETGGDPLQLRDADPDDLDALAELWRNAWRDGHIDHVPPALAELRTPESFRARLEPMIGDTRVCEIDGLTAGFCTLKDDELNQLMVSAEARGAGVAAALMQDAETRLKRAGHGQAWLACAVGNERAAAFYRKSGWHVADTVTLAVETLGDPFPLRVWRFEKTL
ncbi:MAG: GNAT family N-acetyltransferase [Minwuia sp.]|uniref:GNAT family N-acetyltransferase n=1 Tax=Minwuia sp. TaxID=2493630 RepID=UPI003A861F85